MNILRISTIAALAALLGGMTLPALAQNPGGSETMPGYGMSRMMNGGHTGRDMTGGSMMGGMMSGGCGGMMQSMNGG